MHARAFTRLIMYLSIPVACGIAAPSAIAQEQSFVASFEYGHNVYFDGDTEPSHSSYTLAMRVLRVDDSRRTPLGSVPGVWLYLDSAWLTASNDSASFLVDEGGGGVSFNFRIGGPWRLLRTRHLMLSAGLGLGAGLHLGTPVERGGGDAFLMGVAQTTLGGLRTLIEGEYAVGNSYTEQRLYAHVALGMWTLEATLLFGQATADYLQFGIGLGLRLDSE